MNIVKAFIERNKDNIYSVYVDLDDNTLNYGIHGTGNTAKEAVEDFMSAYEAMKEFYALKGKCFVETEFNFQYDVASFLQYYSDRFTLAGLQNITGINQRQLSHYVTGLRKPGTKTIHKIETALHNFAKELSQINFA
jgi:predicted RNase H-like HicB family nuclease